MKHKFSIFWVLFLYIALLGDNNRISLTVGVPDLIGFEYQRSFNNFYIAFSPHVLASILYSYPVVGSDNYDIAIFPSFSFGYNFYKKSNFTFGSDLIVTPVYLGRTFEDTVHEKSVELSEGLRLIPSFTFSKISLSLCAGIFFDHVLKPFDRMGYPNGDLSILPSIALKVGYNF